MKLSAIILQTVFQHLVISCALQTRTYGTNQKSGPQMATSATRTSYFETSVFGAEFVALKISIKSVRGFRYKLYMMGIPLSGAS